MTISNILPASTTSSQHVSTPQGQKLHKAAAEFESQLLSSLWKSMKHSFAEEDDSEDPASQSLSDWGIDAMSGAVSRAGGMGIGKLIIKDLTQKLANYQNGNLPKKL
jgi:Rod binding domain-containing protein